MENCYSCDKQIEGKWDSAIQLSIEMGELEGEAKSRFFFHDKCIKCSPSRAQHIVHPKFPAVKDDREQYNKMFWDKYESCLLYTSPSPRDRQKSRMPSSA